MLSLLSPHDLTPYADYDSESTALTVGEEGRQFQDKAYSEILAVLQAQSADVDRAL